MSEDKARIDSHKLMLHPQRVGDWLSGKVVYPINLEVCLIGACNHRCTFCCCDYMEHKPDRISQIKIEKIFFELKEKGLKSVLFAGSGEPLLHTEFSDIVNNAKCLGIDVAVSTNGVLFTPEIAEECLNAISWIRYSISAGKEETYNDIHRGRPGDLQRVLDNISYAAELKRKKNYQTDLNVQIVMVPENVDEIVLLAERVKKCGADRYIVKSYGENLLMKNIIKKDATKEFFFKHSYIKEKLIQLNDNDFHVVYRQNRIQNEFSQREYDACLASAFHACICADGSVCPCCHLQGIEEFSFGNINDKTFSEIWESDSRTEVMNKIKESKLAPCPGACKLDLMNRYLHELIHPDKHVNFL